MPKKPGYIYVKKNEKYEQGSKQPALKGFISLTREALRELNAAPVDETYGTVKLNVALWRSDKESGLFTGSVEVQQTQQKQVKTDEPF